MARKAIFGGTWALGIFCAALLFVLTPASGPSAAGSESSSSAVAQGAGRTVEGGVSDVRAMATASEYFISAGAHLAGAAGTNWRTDVEVHNCGAVQASFTIYLLKRDQDNSSPQTRSYSLGPGQSVRYSDILMQVFGYSGAAALRVTVGSGCVMVNSRTYNQLSDGTYGQFVRGQPVTEAVPYGQQGRLFHLTHTRSASFGFRTNVGLVNPSLSGVSVQLQFYTASGALLGVLQRNLGAYGYVQIDKAFEQVTGNDVADGFVVVIVTTPGGRVFSYASVVDNPKGDAVFIPVEVIAPAVAPTATASPTSTVPPSPSYGPLTFSSGFNESTGQPVNPGTSFSYGITTLYGSWPYANVAPGTSFSYEWYRNGGYLTGGTGTLPVVSGKAWQWIQMNNSGPLTSGTYELRIKVGGQVVLSGQATIGAAPTPTTQASTVNLAKVNPTGWPNCVVCNWRELNPPQSEFLSIYYDTHLYWSTANLGPATLYGPVRFGVYVDNVQIKSIRYDNPSGWPAGSGLAFHFVLTEIETAGQHTVVVAADWDDAIAETNESDNSCGFTGTWESIVFSANDAEAQPESPWPGDATEIVDLAGHEDAPPAASVAPLGYRSGGSVGPQPF